MKNPVPNTRPNGNNYALGDSVSERSRLKQQAERLAPLSERFLADAGLRPGMLVLELGGGSGHFTRLIAERVGHAGKVVVLERSEAMLHEARENLKSWGLSQVEFHLCNLETTLPKLAASSFDALVGRLILTHLTQPVDVLSQCREFVKAEGIVAFQEADTTLAEVLLEQHRHELPLVYQITRWIKLAEEGSSRNPHLGRELFEIFRQAGLPTPTVQVHTELQSGVSTSRIQSTLVLLRNLLPELQRRGITEAEIGFETLEARLTQETASSPAVQAHTSIVSAWTMKD
ncbi:MAG: class I SAM-dependent methyltransferase [Gemmatales bacterium]